MSVPNPTPQQYPEPPEPVRAEHIGNETVIRLDEQLVLVASTSEPDVWHVVERGHCDCKAFRFRETCRHLALAAPRSGVKKGERPPRWGGPAIFDEAELAGADAKPDADTELARVFGGWQS